MKKLLVLVVIAQTAMFSPVQAQAQSRGQTAALVLGAAVLGGIIGYNLADNSDNGRAYHSAYNACLNNYNCGDRYNSQVMVIQQPHPQFAGQFQQQRVRPFFTQGARGTLNGPGLQGVRCRSFQVVFRDVQFGQVVGQQNRVACLTRQHRWSEDPAAFGLPRNQGLGAYFVRETDWRRQAWRSVNDMPMVMQPPRHQAPAFGGPIVVQQRPPIFRPPPPSGPIFRQPPAFVNPGLGMGQRPPLLPPRAQQQAPQFRPGFGAPPAFVPGRQQAPPMRMDCRSNPSACPAVLPAGRGMR